MAARCLLVRFAPRWLPRGRSGASARVRSTVRPWSCGQRRARPPSRAPVSVYRYSLLLATRGSPGMCGPSATSSGSATPAAAARPRRLSSAPPRNRRSERKIRQWRVGSRAASLVITVRGKRVTQCLAAVVVENGGPLPGGTRPWRLREGAADAMVEQPHDERSARAARRHRRTSVAWACVRGLTFAGFAATAWLLGTSAAQADTADSAPHQPIPLGGVVEVVESPIPRLLPQGLLGAPADRPTNCHAPSTSPACPDPTTTGRHPSGDPASGDVPAAPTPTASDPTGTAASAARTTGDGRHASVTDQSSGVLPAGPPATPSTRLSAEPSRPVVEPGQPAGAVTTVPPSAPAPAGAVPSGSTDVLATVVHHVTAPLSRLPLGVVTGPVTGALVGTTRLVGDTLVPAVLSSVPNLSSQRREPSGRRPAALGPTDQSVVPTAAPRIDASTGGETTVAPSVSGSSAGRRQIGSRGTVPEVPSFPVPAPFPAYPGAGLSHGGSAGGGPTSHSEAGANATVGVATGSDTSADRVPAVTARLGVLPEHAEDPAVSPD